MALGNASSRGSPRSRGHFQIPSHPTSMTMAPRGTSTVAMAASISSRPPRLRLETIESELTDVRGRLDRLYDLVETTTEFNMADFAHRIRDHRERQERLESAAEGARAILAQRRGVLDHVKTITAYAQDMNRFLRKSELAERRAFIETFVKEIELLPDNAVVRYTVPMPEDSFLAGGVTEKVPLNGSVLASIHVGGQ